MTVEELFISLGFKTDKASLGKVQSDANALKSKLGKLLGVVGVSLSLVGIKNFVESTAAIAADVKSTNNQFNLTFKGMEKTAAGSLRNVSKETGIAESRMKMTYARIASFAKTGGMSAAEANDFTSRSMKALADNAAYMDKSIEDTADTFQKLLKGNFNLDDNLNFNLSQAERDQMAMQMFNAKNYNALDENQKKELILQKLIQANRQMGAENQAKRESGEYTNQIGELNDNIKMLKANIGSMFLPMVLRISTRISGIVQNIADWLGNADDEGSRASRIMKDNEKVLDHIDTFISSIMSDFDSHKSEIRYHLENGKNTLKTIWDILVQVTDSMGGIDNVIRDIAFTWVQFKIVESVGDLVSKLRLIKPLITAITSPVAIAAALVMGIFLIIQDIVYFFQGKNSLLGDMIGNDPAKIEKFRNMIEEIVDDAKELWSILKGIGTDLGGPLGDLFKKITGKDFNWKEFFRTIVEGLLEIADVIVDTVSIVADAIKLVIDLIEGRFDELDDDIKKITGHAKEIGSDLTVSVDKDSKKSKSSGGYYRNGHYVTYEESDRRDKKQENRLNPRNFRNGTYVGNDVYGSRTSEAYVTEDAGYVSASNPSIQKRNLDALKSIASHNDGRKKLDAILRNQTANPKVVANNSGNTANVTQNISFSNTFNGASEQAGAAAKINGQVREFTQQTAMALAKAK